MTGHTQSIGANPSSLLIDGAKGRSGTRAVVLFRNRGTEDRPVNIGKITKIIKITNPENGSV